MTATLPLVSRLAGALVAAGAVLAPGATATAQTACLPTADLMLRLERGFGEVPVAQGVGADGNLIQVLAGRDGGTWTLVVTLPTGTSCVLGIGEGWSEVTPAVAGLQS